MPNMADVTIKKADGTTNVIYVKKAPASGDRTNAVWTADAESAIHAHRPEFKMSTRSNQNGTKPARLATAVFKFPVVETVSGIPTVVATVPMRMEITLPTNVDSTKVNEAIAQGTNLLTATLIRDSFKEGFAPT